MAKVYVRARKGFRIGHWYYVAYCDTCNWRIGSAPQLSWDTAMRAAESHHWIYNGTSYHRRRRK